MYCTSPFVVSFICSLSCMSAVMLCWIPFWKGNCAVFAGALISFMQLYTATKVLIWSAWTFAKPNAFLVGRLSTIGLLVLKMFIIFTNLAVAGVSFVILKPPSLLLILNARIRLAAFLFENNFTASRTFWRLGDILGGKWSVVSLYAVPISHWNESSSFKGCGPTNSPFQIKLVSMKWLQQSLSKWGASAKQKIGCTSNSKEGLVMVTPSALQKPTFLVHMSEAIPTGTSPISLILPKIPKINSFVGFLSKLY